MHSQQVTSLLFCVIYGKQKLRFAYLQICLLCQPPDSLCGLHRGHAYVKVFLDGDEEPQSEQNQAMLEVWTNDGLMGYHKPTASRSHLSLEVTCGQKRHPVMRRGKSCNENELVIGRPGMKKLGLGFHPDGHVIA